MSSPFTYKSYTTNMRDIYDVISAMESLETELYKSEMQNLIPFNHTYLIITKAVSKQLGNNYFNNDQRMQKFDVTFMQYYFDALYAYINHQECAPAWKFLFDACKKNNLLQSIYMALGVNAHVNNDLAFTLYDSIKDNDYKDDYDKVNNIIKQCIEEVILFINEKPKFMNTSKNIFSKYYSYFLFYLIKNWRENAWSQYNKLKESDIYSVTIKQHALKRAKQITFYKII